jgi:hypothetical protein
MEWVEDSAGWHGFFWPEQDGYRAGAPRGWLDLEQVRPAGHETRVVVSPAGYPPGAVDPSWWPPDN